MPALSRWFIKAAILYFMAGLILALISELPAFSALLLPVYWHMLVIGWLTQVIMGVSLWMFPGRGRPEDRTRLVRGWTAFILLNSGLVLRFLSEPFLPIIADDPIITTSIILSSILQISGILIYILELWPRLQPSKRRQKTRS